MGARAARGEVGREEGGLLYGDRVRHRKNGAPRILRKPRSYAVTSSAPVEHEQPSAGGAVRLECNGAGSAPGELVRCDAPPAVARRVVAA